MRIFLSLRLPSTFFEYENELRTEEKDKQVTNKLFTCLCFLYNFTDWLTVVIGCFIIFAIMLNFTDYLFEMIINSIVRGRCKVDRNRLCNICKWTMNWISSHLECARALMLFLVKTWFWFGFLFIRCFWFPLRSMELCFEGGSFYAIIFLHFSNNDGD